MTDDRDIVKHRILTGDDSPAKRFLTEQMNRKPTPEVIDELVVPVKRRFKTLEQELRAMETMPLPEKDPTETIDDRLKEPLVTGQGPNRGQD